MKESTASIAIESAANTIDYAISQIFLVSEGLYRNMFDCAEVRALNGTVALLAYLRDELEEAAEAVRNAGNPNSEAVQHG